MDLTNMISGGTEEQQVPEQKLTKEEYAAKKQQEREEVWAEVDAQAQDVFQKGEKLKGFLDFMAKCNTQRTPNLLLIDRKSTRLNSRHNVISRMPSSA